jgi:hypothetical protein
MKVIQELQGAYFKHLKTKLNTPIFNYVPDEVLYPFIKIGRIDAYPWLIIPLSYIIKMDLEIYSQNTSNIEILEIVNQLDAAISNFKPSLTNFRITSVEIEDTRLDPSHNNIWTANISLKLKIVKI